MISISELNELEKLLGTTDMSEEDAINSIHHLVFDISNVDSCLVGMDLTNGSNTYVFKEMSNAVDNFNVTRIKDCYLVISESHLHANELAPALLLHICLYCTKYFADAIKYRRSLLRCEQLNVEMDEIEAQMIASGLDPYKDKSSHILKHGFSDEQKRSLLSLLEQQNTKFDGDNFGYVYIDKALVIDYYDKDNLGYVYALENKALNAVKIGKTKDPKSRIRNLQNMAGCRDAVFVWGEFYNYHDVEIEAHKVFSNSNHMQEWFNIEIGEASKVIKRLAAQQPEPTKAQLTYSKMIDDYNGFCQLVAFTANNGFSGIKQEVVIE
ncbi:GIY-YIG nuclease family protein [Psychrobacter sp.]|uniref:GIY-YIG nuclease family protein n=1 Tax=Psychrobacter sp. TaxID=56811 RepID=UPI003C77CFAE